MGILSNEDPSGSFQLAMGTIETVSPITDLFIKKPFGGKKNGDLGLN
jgi:hypothetical protein